MAYPNYYSNYQSPYYSAPLPDQLAQFRQGQYQPQMQSTQMPATPQTGGNGMIWVQGEEGAKAYMVAPGNSVFLMDSEANVFYIKSSDASGMPMPLRIFDYTERTAAKPMAQMPFVSGEDYVTRQEFNELAARIEEITHTAKETVENE